jgi:hypothetical protein
MPARGDVIEWTEASGLETRCPADAPCTSPEQLSCGGHRIAWTSHGVFASTGRSSQWLDLGDDDDDYDDRDYRITGVRCEADARLVISHRHPSNLLDSVPAPRDEAVVDFRRHTWSIR